MLLFGVRHLIFHLLFTSLTPVNISQFTARNDGGSNTPQSNESWTPYPTSPYLDADDRTNEPDKENDITDISKIYSTDSSLASNKVLSSTGFSDSSPTEDSTEVNNSPNFTGYLSKDSKNSQGISTTRPKESFEMTYPLVKTEFTISVSIDTTDEDFSRSNDPPMDRFTSTLQTKSFSKPLVYHYDRDETYVTQGASHELETISTAQMAYSVTTDPARSVKDITELIESDSCSQYGSCDFVSTLQFQYCGCDELCSLYGDCCFDANPVNKSTVLTTAHFECSPYSSYDKYDGILIVKQCPDTMDGSEIDMKCRADDILTVGPYVMDEHGIVYQNRHCAECNGKRSINAFSIKISNVRNEFIQDNMNFTSLFNLQDLLLNQTGFYKTQKELVPPNGTYVRRCLMLHSVMKETEECRNYFNNHVIQEGRQKILIFRNQYCAPTDGKPKYCLGPFIDYIPIDEQLYDFFPLSVIFRFTQTDQECANKKSEKRFEKHKFAERKITDRWNNTEVNGMCLERDMYTHYPVRLFFKLISTVPLPKRQTLQLLLALAWSLTPDVEVDQLTVMNTIEINNSSFSSDIDMAMFIDKQMFGNDMLKYEKELKKYQWQTRVNLPGDRAIEAYIYMIKSNDTFRTPDMWYFVNNHGLGIEMNNANIRTELNVNDRILCGQHLMECELDNLSENSVLIIKSLTCLDETLQNWTASHADNKKIIITYAGMGLSVLALVGFIIVHRVIGMSKSVPGSNVENLSVSLLLSNVLFMVGVGANDYQTVCYIIGIALHYLWLSVFSFKSIAMVHMCHNLRKMSANTAHTNVQKPNKKIPFTILGLLLPVIFMTPSLVLDYLNVSGYTPKYGGSVCFPTGYPANLIFVSTPIGLSVLVNILCFICIAVVITKQSLASRHVRKTSSFQHVSVFARISAVTGIFWITGILGAVFETEAIEYVFITCCSLQGFCVALANVTTNRVIRKIREHFDI